MAQILTEGEGGQRKVFADHAPFTEELSLVIGGGCLWVSMMVEGRIFQIRFTGEETDAIRAKFTK